MNKFTSKIDGINKLELQNLKKRLDQVFIELTKLHSDSKKLGIDNLNLLKAKNLIDDTLDDIDLSIKILK
ncbi:TPA: hypothetical protein R1765_001939 [Campylobacter coli]|nr:hypothetical protein [Campylobacter coli]